MSWGPCNTNELQPLWQGTLLQDGSIPLNLTGATLSIKFALVGQTAVVGANTPAILSAVAGTFTYQRAITDPMYTTPGSYLAQVTATFANGAEKTDIIQFVCNPSL